MGAGWGHFGNVRSLREAGGVPHVLMVGCDYLYSPQHMITGIRDGQNFERIARHGHSPDIVFMRDDYPRDHPLFPTRANVMREIQNMGRRCRPVDYFVFFYAGHGISVVDQSGDEEDGFDEAYLLPEPNGALVPMIDDDWADVVDSSLHRSVQVLAVTDCCHSGTIADVDSHNWGWRPICSMAACRDREESWDTGRGGMLTRALENAVAACGKRHGNDEYSIAELWDEALDYVHQRQYRTSPGVLQEPLLDYRNMNPSTAPWPFPQSWLRYAPGSVPAKLGQDVRALKTRRMSSSSSVGRSFYGAYPGPMPPPGAYYPPMAGPGPPAMYGPMPPAPMGQPMGMW